MLPEPRGIGGLTGSAVLLQYWLALTPLDAIDWSDGWYILCHASWSLLWIVRRFRNDRTCWTDFFIFIFFQYLDFRRNSATAVAPTSYFAWLSPVTYPVLALTVFWNAQGPIRGWLDQQNGAANPSQHTPSGPQLYASRTSHTRLFPEKHSFAYDYLLVVVPVGWQGCSGSLLSVSKPGRSWGLRKHGWFNVKPENYLDRTSPQRDLRSKLRDYLRSQGVPDTEWSHAYLATAPRFLGYSFNPVSFWYIYDSENELRMMILEVNNTFDEKRMYLLNARGRNSQDVADLTPELGEVEQKDADTTIFTASWSKDFHVSPFNSRKGSYSVAARDPMQADGAFSGEISNTIVLRSSKGHPKLVARISSNGSPMDPSNASLWAQASFLLRWWFVGFLTFPRIIFEAYKLYVSRKLHVWFRPEVLPESIGRNPTAEEIFLQIVFEKYLAFVVSQAKAPMKVVYHPGIASREVVTFANVKQIREAAKIEPLHVRVLTPAFYSRLVHYVHAQEAFDRECLLAGDKNQTIALSDPKLLPSLAPPEPSSFRDVFRRLGFVNRIRWLTLQILRCPPPSVSYPLTGSTDPQVRRQDIRQMPLSFLDRFVQANLQNDVQLYRRTVTRLFLSQRYAFGFPGVVVLVDFLLRLALVFGARGLISQLHAASTQPLPAFLVNDVANGLPRLLLFNVLHVWSWIKGL